MSVIRQLPLPLELQEHIKYFVYYTKIELYQRKLKETLIKQMNCCERVYWKDGGQYYDYFYYRISNCNIFKLEPNIYYIVQEFKIMSTIFCKDCHQYVSSETPIPLCIECDCIPEWLMVD